VEVGQAVLALNLIHTELDLAEGVVLVILQVSEGDLEDAALQRVIGVLQTAGTVDQSLADTWGNPLAFHAHTYSPNSWEEVIHTRGSGRSREPA
jgi:hypothetical protein